MRDLLKEAKKINDVSEDKLIEYTDTMVRMRDVSAHSSFIMQDQNNNNNNKSSWSINVNVI